MFIKCPCGSDIMVHRSSWECNIECKCGKPPVRRGGLLVRGKPLHPLPHRLDDVGPREAKAAEE